MTSEQIYGKVCAMLQEYDLHTGSRGADNVIANPQQWTVDPLASCYPFYSAGAALLMDALTRMDGKASDRYTVAAAKRIIKGAPRDEFRGLFRAGDRWIACDGFRLLRFQNDFASLPHVENRFDVGAVMKNAGPTADELHLPSVSDLKAFMAADKAKHGKVKTPYCLDGFIWVNPQFLVDMLQALPGCKAYKPASPCSAIYCRADNGDDGILLPIRPPKAQEQQKPQQAGQAEEAAA